MKSAHPHLDLFLKSAKQEWQKMKPGLERMEAACELLENPQKRYPSIHVAGTNGKGSVCAMLQSVLTEAGYKVGLFTSPHLVKVNERFRIGNQEISNEELEKILDVIASDCKERGNPATKWPLLGVSARSGSSRALLNAQGPHDDSLFSTLSFFELCTLIAFLYFAEQKVDIAILETGLGGRLDATNVVTPLISVITEIGLDHTEILGTDIASIAREKAGIIKEGIPVVCGASHLEARKVIEEVARERNSEILYVGAPPRGRPMVWAGTGTHPYGFKYKLNLKGSHQIHNAEIVLKVLEILLNLGVIARSPGSSRDDVAISQVHSGDFHASLHSARNDIPIEESIQKGLQNVRWPGRMEWISKDPPILMDGAHNVEGVRALVEYLKSYRVPSPLEGEGLGEGEVRWKILFSAASDKKIGEMLNLLQEVASEIILCKMENSRSIDPEKILSVRTQHAAPLRMSQNSIQSFHEIKKSLREGEGILITGSLYFIGQFKRQVFHERSPTNG